MYTITMTSPKLAGEVVFTYNEQNRLSSLLITEPLDDKQYIHLLSNIPWQFGMLPDFAAKTTGATFVEKQLEVTFEMFWNRYNDKDRSSKKKTLQQWNKMTKADQVKSYLYIPVYWRKKGSAEKKYATTYLSDELWNN